MCAVSQIAAYGYKKVPWHQFEDPVFRDSFQKLIDSAKEFDDATAQPDCETDEAKEWLKERGFPV